jgi:transcriptional regulator with XRE-family HTH domain
MAEDLEIFAANLRRARIERDMTQEALAAAAAVDLRHFKRIEQAQREPGVRTAARLARALGVSAAVLFDGIDGR